MGCCYQLPHYREVISDDWGQRLRERWEEEGDKESGAVGQEDGEVHQRMVDVGRCGGRYPKPEEQCIRCMRGRGRVEDHSVYTLMVEFEGFVCRCPCVDLGRILTFVR